VENVTIPKPANGLILSASRPAPRHDETGLIDEDYNDLAGLVRKAIELGNCGRSWSS